MVAAAAGWDYTVVGHVSVDVLPDGTEQVGGAAFYSGLQAARLGLRTRILTAGEPDRIRSLLAPVADELALEIQPSEATTSYAADWVGGRRVLRLVGWAGEIEPPSGADGETRPGCLHLAPIADELPEGWAEAAAGYGTVIATPQGWIRRWDGEGRIARVALEAGRLPSNCSVAVISRSELPFCRSQLEPVAAIGVVAVTRGAEGVEIEAAGERIQLPPPRLIESGEDLGAGDVFATALAVALDQGATVEEAAQFGQAAAAVKLSGRGPLSVASRAAIETELG